MALLYGTIGRLLHVWGIFKKEGGSEESGPATDRSHHNARTRHRDLMYCSFEEDLMVNKPMHKIFATFYSCLISNRKCVSIL